MMNDIEQYFKDNNIDIQDIRTLKLLMQQNNDLLKGGLRSNNITNFRTIDTFNCQDSLDATYPMYMHLNISEDMTKIVSIKLSFWLQPFRSYDKSAASGGGATSGATGAPSGGGSTSGSGGGQTSSSSNISSAIWTQVTTVTHEGVTNILRVAAGLYRVLFGVDSVTAIVNHTHTVANHTHTTPAHTHPAHTHSVPAHTHDMTFGIYEETNSPTIGFQISRDNGATYGVVLGQYTTDIVNLEIKDYIEKAGSYIVRFTSTARARLSAQLTAKLDIVAR